MQGLMDVLVDQLLNGLLGNLVAALVSAVGVGGFLWKKLDANAKQDARMQGQDDRIDKLEGVVRTMACHQLELSCHRAIERGCITFDEKQEIKRLYDKYRGEKWNGPGEIAYKEMDKLPVREDCEDNE